MIFARTILALVIALSVAMLPTAGGAASKSKAQEATEISASEPMHDCCPPDANPCDKAAGDCASMALCALKYLSLSATSSSVLIFPPVLAIIAPPFASNPFHSQTASPPFRPPRV
jgi:hypothetical protein